MRESGSTSVNHCGRSLGIVTRNDDTKVVTNEPRCCTKVDAKKSVKGLMPRFKKDYPEIIFKNITVGGLLAVQRLL